MSRNPSLGFGFCLEPMKACHATLIEHVHRHAAAIIGTDSVPLHARTMAKASERSRHHRPGLRHQAPQYDCLPPRPTPRVGSFATARCLKNRTFLGKCKTYRPRFSVTSSTLFAVHRMPVRNYLAAAAIFGNAVKGKSALAVSRDLDTWYKTTFPLGVGGRPIPAARHGRCGPSGAAAGPHTTCWPSDRLAVALAFERAPVPIQSSGRLRRGACVTPVRRRHSEHKKTPPLGMAGPGEKVVIR